MRSFFGSFRLRIIISVIIFFAGISAIYLLHNSKNSQGFDSAEKTLEKYRLLAQKSPSDALQTLRNDSAHVPEINAMCHRISHEIGRISMKQSKNFKDAVAQQDSFCNSGYLHGAIEEFLSHQTINSETLQKVCPLGSKFSYYDWECWHGIGHGIMYSNDNNLKSSLAICEDQKNTSAKAACANGVFMELFGQEQTEKNPDINPFSICSEQPPELKSDCYLYTASSYLTIHKKMYKEAFTWCKTAEKEYIKACIQGVGAEVIKTHLDDIKLVDQTCQSSGDYNSCITGVASYSYFHFGSSRPVGYICLQLSEDGSKICSSTRKQLADQFPADNTTIKK